MIKENLQKIMDLVKVKEEGNNKRKIENLIVFVVLLIFTVIMINTIWKSDVKEDKEKETDTSKVLAEINSDESDQDSILNNDLEDKLKKILSKIEGVGNVDVLLTYSESSKTLAMYNEDTTSNDTEEKDTRRSEIEK